MQMRFKQQRNKDVVYSMRQTCASAIYERRQEKQTNTGCTAETGLSDGKIKWINSLEKRYMYGAGC